MRHVWSLIAGLLLTPLAWLLIAFGQAEMDRGEITSGVNNHLLLGGLLLVAVGLLLGLIGSLRTSPIGAMLAALIFLGASVFTLLAPLDALNVFGEELKVAGYQANLSSPLTSGILGVVGGMLLLAVFSPARWRGRPTTETEVPWDAPTSSTPDTATIDTETEKLESRA